MQSILNHYNASAYYRNVAVSIDAGIRLIYGEIKPIALEVWAIYTSEQAKRCYEFLILSVIALVALIAYSTFWLGCRAREQYDRFWTRQAEFVESCLEQPTAIAPAADDALTAEELLEEGCAEAIEIAPEVAIAPAPVTASHAPTRHSVTPKRKRRAEQGRSTKVA